MLAQFLFSLSLLRLVLAIPGAAAAGSICTKAPYSAILSFSNYAPAQSFCSSYFPIKPITVKTTVTPVTTTTVVTTVTTGAAKVKRDATSSKWKGCSSSLSKSGALSTACSCIETPKTVTSTITAPKTSTTTVTSTTTTTTSRCTPGPTTVGAGNVYSIYCSQSATEGTLQTAAPVPQPNFGACVSACDDDSACAALNYRYSDLSCTLLDKTGRYPDPGSYQLTADPDYDSAVLISA